MSTRVSSALAASWLGLAALACFAPACSRSAIATPDDGGAGDAAVAIDAATTVDAAVSPDGAPLRCGGFTGMPCPGGMFCDLPAGMCCCDNLGTCQPLPGGCTKQYQPVCGCDGNTYGNDCERQMAGVSLDYMGVCVKPYACGAMTCQPSEECFQGCSGIGPPPPPQCQPAPSSCNGHVSCSCIQLQQLQQCQDLMGGGVLVTQTGCA